MTDTVDYEKLYRAVQDMNEETEIECNRLWKLNQWYYKCIFISGAICGFIGWVIGRVLA